MPVIIDETFFIPRTSVAIASFGDGLESHTLRSTLENMGCAVTLHLLGTPQDLLKVLGQGENAPHYLVLCGHGDDNGLVFGEFGAGIVPENMLVAGSLPPNALEGQIALPGTVILNTACQSGSAAFAKSFLAGDVQAYIAPDGFPSGAEVMLFLHHFFYQLVRVGADWKMAYRHAQSYDANSGVFRLFAEDK